MSLPIAPLNNHAFPTWPQLQEEAKKRIKANWKKVLIGDVLSEKDVLRAGQLGWDIILCGIMGAFSLLMICAAFLLPPELRVIVWLGSAFMLVGAVERPSWDALIALPLIVLILCVGAVTLIAIVVHLPPDLIVYFALEHGFWEGGLPFAVGLWFALTVGRLIIWAVMNAFASEDEEGYRIKRRLKKELDIRTRGIWITSRFDHLAFKDSRMYPLETVIIPLKNPGDQDRLAEISTLLQRPVGLYFSKRTHRPALVFVPVQKEGAENAPR